MNNNLITKTLIPEKERPDFLPSYFGIKCVLFENTVYSYMDHFCKEYRGGYWHFYRLSNGSFYLALDSEKPFDVCFPENYFEESMSADAIGIAVTLFALNRMTYESTPKQTWIDAYHGLHDYVCEHKEAGAILRLID